MLAVATPLATNISHTTNNESVEGDLIVRESQYNSIYQDKNSQIYY